MKVGLVVPGFSSDATDWCIPVLVDVVRELSRRARVFILTLRYPPQRDHYSLHGAQVQTLGKGSSGLRRAELLSRGVAALCAEHRRERLDVLHGLWADEPGAIAVTAARLLRIPSVVSVMGGELVAMPDIGYGGSLSSLNRLLIAYALRSADRVTTGSSAVERLVRCALPPHHHGKIRRIVWGIDSSLFPAAAPPRELAGSFRVLSVGSLVPVKDHPMLLRAFARLREHEPAAHLHLVGDGPMRAPLNILAIDLGLADAVTFHGYVPRQELASFYRAGHTLAVSSQYEAQHVGVLEAATCCLPIVGTAVGIVPDLAPEAALAVPIGAELELAEALATLLDSELRRRMGSAAQHLTAGYRANETAKQLTALYRVRQSAISNQQPSMEY
jgi:glycosyltransferase involved in cell wall biosynthesis